MNEFDKFEETEFVHKAHLVIKPESTTTESSL